MQIIEYIMVRWSYTFVCTLHYLIIIRIQTYMKVLESYNTCQVHYILRVSKIKAILAHIFHAMYGTVCIQFTPFSYDNFENICT